MDSPISPSPPFLRSLSSSKSIAPSDEETSTTIEVTMYQCKIEFLTGLVMIQKSDWSTAVETFNAAITILERVREMDKRSRPWERHTRRLRRWWSHTLRRPTNAVLPAKAHPRQGLQYRPSRDQLVDEVEAYMVVAKRLKAKILKAERDRDRINNDIRVQGLRCISKVSEREAREEIGLDPSLVSVVTVLEPFLSKHLLRVAPVVAILHDKNLFKPVLNADEVEEIFDAPLEMFLKDENRRWEEREWNGVKYIIHYFDFLIDERKFVIWGLTAGILIRAASAVYQRPPSFSMEYSRFKIPRSLNGNNSM